MSLKEPPPKTVDMDKIKIPLTQGHISLLSKPNDAFVSWFRGKVHPVGNDIIRSRTRQNTISNLSQNKI